MNDHAKPRNRTESNNRGTSRFGAALIALLLPAHVLSAGAMEGTGIASSGPEGGFRGGGDAGWYSQSAQDWKISPPAHGESAPPMTLAQAKAAPREGGDVGQAIGELTSKVLELENALEAVRVPNRYVVIGLIRAGKDAPALKTPIENLPIGKTSGLPTIQYNWPGPDFRSNSNIHWHPTAKAGKEGPAGWTWTHVAAKSFATLYEAEAWLDKSTEGSFLRENAEAILTLTVTEYSSVASGAYPSLQMRKVK